MASPIRDARARPTSMSGVSQKLPGGIERTDAARFGPGDERHGCRWRRPRAHRVHSRVRGQSPLSAAGRALRAAMQAPRTSVRSGCGACTRENRSHRAQTGPRPDSRTSGKTGPSAAGRHSSGAAVLHAQVTAVANQGVQRAPEARSCPSVHPSARRLRGEGDGRSPRRRHHTATTPSVRGSVAPAYAPESSRRMI